VKRSGHHPGQHLPHGPPAGSELVARLGGLHRFIGWDGPILTDSGGYQVFSLAELNHVSDEGVKFRSHIDGQWLHLDPVSATRIQNQLGPTSSWRLTNARQGMPTAGL